MDFLNGNRMYLALFALSLSIFSNTFDADFVFDDSQAIVSNPLVTDPPDLWSLLENDFWGTPMSHPGSHRSWRPLTTATFRLNYIMGGMDPKGFHMTNVILHAVASCLVFRYSLQLTGDREVSAVSSILFSLHPIHCEAVAGIVGRADVLSTIFGLIGLISHETYRDLRLTIFLALLAVLSKENGVILIPLVIIREFVRNRGKCTLHTLHLTCSFLVICWCRHSLNGFNSPSFSSSDNPAAHSDSLSTRTLTFLYLPIFHLGLLLLPIQLCFDWSMNAIPLVESIFDMRFLLSVTVYSTLVVVFWRLGAENLSSLFSQIKSFVLDENSFPKSRKVIRIRQQLAGNGEGDTNSRGDVLFLSLSLLVLPHLLASNLFAYVGFVAAERILYLNSVGFCMTIALGLQKLQRRLEGRPNIAEYFFIFLCLLYGIRTYGRNFDWKNEENLYRSAVHLNPPKAYANLGHVLARKGKVAEAELVYQKALEHLPNMADTYYNLGILYRNSNRLALAISSYETAIKYRPNFANSYLNLGLVLWELSRDPLPSFLKCIQLDGSRLKMPRRHMDTVTSCAYNGGRYFTERGQHKKAAQMYRKAISTMSTTYPSRVSVLNMLGDALSHIGLLTQAEVAFEEALKSAPDHLPAHLTMGQLRHKQNRTEEASRWFEKAIRIAPLSAIPHMHHGLFRAQMGDLRGAKESYLKALKFDPNHSEVLNLIATTCRERGENREAERYLSRLVTLSPNAISYANYGAILHLNGKYKEAELQYSESLKRNPNDTVTQQNMVKLRRILGRQWDV